MGFFSSISDFVSQNFQSATQDVGNVANQVVTSPIYQGVVTAGAASFGIPPQVTQTALGFTSGLTSQVAGNNNPSGVVQQQPTNVNYFPQVTASNQPVYTQVPQTNSQPNQNKFFDSVKQNWYYIAIPIVAIIAWFYFKPKNSRYVKR
jgi:hypothetical protein